MNRDPEWSARAHARKKHLNIFPTCGAWGVFVKAFVVRVRAGIPKDELAALIEAHKFPSERITVEELRRRAKADE